MDLFYSVAFPAHVESLMNNYNIPGLAVAIIGLLVHDDQHPEVQYEAPVSSILPDDFVLLTEETTRLITVEDLSHRTVSDRHEYFFLNVRAAEPDTPKFITRVLPMLARVRKAYIYNNMMYAAISHLIEKVTGSKFVDFLDSCLFKPLVMNSTNLQPSRARARGLGDRNALGYY
ncbi:uncharacterized protein ATNIH1004_010613 [Aspergillus tanneri]|uniref:Beta-lactamase-related domain-containing protein n=1 Tax=Aspergillus tanneri TaxID=1220188 RepID=A0A5M9MAC2_9EURO|nr:uncharacterized protein ATNIH1004_010613 [Aspergillus tanneri]KAA8643838.1 hypothetical protein ATNIH1004_010613 [Aspergillus tanneri]